MTHAVFGSLLTHGLGGEGYLNFVGNEFGHPEASLKPIHWLLSVYSCVFVLVARFPS